MLHLTGYAVYAFLFVVGMANESLLTLYYTNAAKGRRTLCVVLSLAQQVVSFGGSFYTLLDCSPGSAEQLRRFAITAVSYGVATYFTVKPAKE